MFASLEPWYTSALHAVHLKQLTKCQQNFFRVITTEQKRHLITDFPEYIKTWNLSSICRPNVYTIGKISMIKGSRLLLEGTNNIKKNTLLPLYIPRYTYIDGCVSIVKSNCTNVTTYSPLSCISINNCVEPSSEKGLQKILPGVLSSNIKIAQVIEITGSTGDDNRVDSNKYMNIENGCGTNVRLTKQTAKSALCLENQQNKMQNIGNICIENNRVTKFHHYIEAIRNGSNREKMLRRKHKLMFLLAGACLSCKKSKKDDSFDETGAVLNQEQVIDADFPDSSSISDDINTKTFKPVAESVTNSAIEKDAQSIKSLFTLENYYEAEVKIVTGDLNSDLDQVNITRIPKNKDEKHLCEIDVNQQNELLNDVQVQEEFLFEELPYASCSNQEVTSPDKSKRKKRKHSYGKYVKTKKSDGNKKAISSDDENKNQARKRPNYFVGIQVSNPQIHSTVKEVQNHIIECEPRLKSALIKPSTLHVTILVCHISDSFELERASHALEASYDVLKERLSINPVYMTFESIGNFNDKILYAELIEDNTLQRLNDIAFHVKTCYEQHGLELSNGKALVPHLTLFKMSKDLSLRKKGVKKIEHSLYEEYKNIRFGVQLVEGLQLLSMLKRKDANGYYHCEKEVLFHT